MNDSSSVRANVGVEAGSIAGCSPVVMNDQSSVSRNQGRQAGGMVVNRVVMNDHSAVVGNSSRQYGGGIYAFTVAMHDHSQIVRDSAHRGGGVYGGGRGRIAVSMSGRSRISRNVARGLGGGIYSRWADVVLRDSASVAFNVAGFAGGGVLSWASCAPDLGRVVVRDRAQVSRNQPDNTATRIDPCPDCGCG